MVFQSITLMLLDIHIMQVLLLALTMVMEMLLAMVPLATEDIMDMVTMDMPTMATMESVMLKLSLMLIHSARSIMDFLYIMPMPLDTLTMLASSLELITDMDMLLDMVQLETVAMLPMAIMVMAMEELGLSTVKDKKKFDTGQAYSFL